MVSGTLLNFGKGQLISFWCLQFHPKNEQKQVDLRYHSSKVKFICSFFGRIHGFTICFRVLLTFKKALDILDNITQNRPPCSNKVQLNTIKGLSTGHWAESLLSVEAYYYLDNRTLDVQTINLFTTSRAAQWLFFVK